MEIAQDETGDRINLMTMHAAKGLEFDTVFLPGWEEGLFPSQRTMDESGLAGLEEERRLAYVGLTRARKRIRIPLPPIAACTARGRAHCRRASSASSRPIMSTPVASTEGFYGDIGFRDNAAGQEFASTYDKPRLSVAIAHRARAKAACARARR